MLEKGVSLPDKTFHFSIETPEKIVFTGDIVSLTAPAEKGYLGVLANHAPFFCKINVGLLKFSQPSQEQKHYAVTHGFMQVGHNTATLYTEAIEAKEEIDFNRAKTAFERARERLKTKQDVDSARAEDALVRAENRIHLHEMS